MATLADSFIDLIDIYKQTDPDGSSAKVIEMLTQNNGLLKDAVAMECNDGSSHVHTIRTGLPTTAWGKLYQGIPNSKSGVAQVRDTTGFLEALSTIDERLIKRYAADKQAAVRLGEAKSFVESLAQRVATAVIYGNTKTNPEQIMGLAPRFSSLSAPNGNQIIDAGGVGADNTSIWMVTWAPEAVTMLYPKGTKAGVQREDKGSQRVLDASNNAYYAMEELFHWDIGLSVADWRYVTRVANIDVSDMATGAVKLYNFLRKAYYRHEGREKSMGKTVIYCNRDVIEALDALSTNAGTTDNFTRLNWGQVEGKEVVSYRGISIRQTDAILNTEARVV